MRTQQVIANLVRNALEAMDGSAHRARDIGVSASPEFVEAAVGDTGPGLPREIADDLFKPFASTKRGGIGIGLPVCREIVEPTTERPGPSPIRAAAPCDASRGRWCAAN